MIGPRRFPAILSLAGLPAWAVAASLVPMAAVSCLVSEVIGPRPEFVRVVDSDSDKGVSIVRNPRLDTHEPGPVAPQTVASAMLASGFFADEDARYLSGPIAAEMPRMSAREQVRIVGWAEDGPRVYYALVHGGRLRLAYHKGAEELERHEAVIPPEAVPIGAVPEPPSVRGSPLGREASEQARPADSAVATTGAAARSPAPPGGATAAPTAPRAQPAAPRPQVQARAAPAGPAPAPLSEEEARRKLRALDELLGKSLITAAEHKRSKREILIRL